MLSIGVWFFSHEHWETPGGFGTGNGMMRRVFWIADLDGGARV